MTNWQYIKRDAPEQTLEDKISIARNKCEHIMVYTINPANHDILRICGNGSDCEYKKMYDGRNYCNK